MTETMHSTNIEAPTVERVRHELKRRELTVTTSERITPNMLRITLTGDELADFASAAPDDHIKISAPMADGEPPRREYTPRRFDTEKRELVIDFAVHDAGPVTEWALAAKPGDSLIVGGPRGSRVINGVTRWLLVGDETALPAIGRRIEEAAPGTAITVIAAVAGTADEQTFETEADLETHWVHRPLSSATDPAPLMDKLASLDIAPGTFVWVAAEAKVTRTIRTHMLEERGLDPQWLKASGYWVQGTADSKENFD